MLCVVCCVLFCCSVVLLFCCSVVRLFGCLVVGSWLVGCSVGLVEKGLVSFTWLLLLVLLIILEGVGLWVLEGNAAHQENPKFSCSSFWGFFSPAQQEMEETLPFRGLLGLVVTRGGDCHCMPMGIFHRLEWCDLTQVVCTVPHLQVCA